MIGISKHGFTKRKSLTNLMTYSDGTIGLADEGRAEDIVYLDLSKTFDTVCLKER